MAQNRNSLIKPLAVAFIPAIASIGYSSGCRGRHKQVAPLSLGESIEIFIVVYLIAFVIAYLLRKLGVD